MKFQFIERTPEEKRDMFLAWQRPDRDFFASGACHILAHQFLSLHLDEGFVLVRIKPNNNLPGNHYYVSNGIWMFDYHGWSLEAEYLESMREVYQERHEKWDFERIEIPEGLVAHIADGDHMLRPPEYFPELPWRRAYDFINQFDSTPPQ